MDATQISQAVNDKYSSIASAASTARKPSCCKPWSAAQAISKDTSSTTNGTCCKPSNTPQSPIKETNGIINSHADGGSGDYASRVAASFGYHPSQLSSLPPNTNLGLSCGNPLALTNVLPHETVIDLGSGGGLDCLLAAKSMVAASQKAHTPLTGRVIGIDSSRAMIALAQRNVEAANLPPRATTHEGSNSTPPSSRLVSFLHAPITTIPLPSSTASLIISNCVLNLLPPDLKPVIFVEIYRLLAPSARLAISDILTLPNTTLPEHLRNNIALHVGCVAGAASVNEYRAWMIDAGFPAENIVFKANGSDLNAYKLTAEEREAQRKQNGDAGGCCGGGGGCGANVREEGKLFDEEVRDVDFNAYVASFEIYAVK